MVQFCKSHFDLFFQTNFPTNAQTSLDQAESDSPRQTRLCRGPRSFYGALVCWQIDFLVISVSQAEMRALDNSVLACTSNILVRIHQFSKKLLKSYNRALDLRS